MTNHNTNTDTNALIEQIADQHRMEHAHTVWVMPGEGWVCEVCDEDWEETLEEYRSRT